MAKGTHSNYIFIIVLALLSLSLVLSCEKVLQNLTLEQIEKMSLKELEELEEIQNKNVGMVPSELEDVSQLRFDDSQINQKEKYFK